MGSIRDEIPQSTQCFNFSGGGNPFSNLEKTAVLQETRTFNETPVNARKCTHILTKILYLINQVAFEMKSSRVSNRITYSIFRENNLCRVKQPIVSLR